MNDARKTAVALFRCAAELTDAGMLSEALETAHRAIFEVQKPRAEEPKERMLPCAVCLGATPHFAYAGNRWICSTCATIQPGDLFEPKVRP